MPEVSRSAELPAPPERAWEIFSDISRYGEWNETHDGFPDGPPELATGTTFREKVTIMGMPGEATWVPRPRRPHSTAVLIVGDRRFALPHECVLGRRGDVARDAFGNDLSVSLEHARLTVHGDVAYLKNVSNGGHALVVNGATLAFGDEAKLKLGSSRVRFGPSFTCVIELIE